MKILIAAGGTGGHIFPAISLAHEIMRKDSSSTIVFCTDKRSQTKKILKQEGFEFYLIDVPRMPFGLSFKWIWFFPRIFKSLSTSDKILNKVSPDIAVGFGAYISGPIIFKAARRRIRTVIHEQNVNMGRANTILSYYVNRIAVSFKDTIKGNGSKFILTGNPLRRQLLEDLKTLTKEDARKELGLDKTKPAVLVLGGSLGSHRINEKFLKMLESLDNQERQVFEIIHLTGTDDFGFVSSFYNQQKIKAYTSSFLGRMGLAYKAADVAICRAGATTVAELCAFGIPAIFIPYPAAGTHQEHNADYLVKKGLAIKIRNRSLSAYILKNEFLNIINDKQRLSAMSPGLKSLARPEAASELAELVLQGTRD